MNITQYVFTAHPQTGMDPVAPTIGSPPLLLTAMQKNATP
jgi:hypothetical protein